MSDVETFYCLIVGSRSFSDYELFVAKCDLLLRNWGSVVIVSGGARGADALAKRYAVDRGYCYMEFPAENEKRRNVELAYLSLMLSGKKVSECELASEVLKISRAKGEKSLAMLVQSSIKITVKVLSVVLEESSKRYVITFRQLGEDSDETIRSERTDGRRGKDVMQLWGRDLKNHICILFKHNEESKDPSKSGGFRVAPYVIDLGLQKN